MHIAVAKVAANAQLSRNLFALSPAEQKLLLEACSLTRSFWISPAAVSGRAYWAPRPNRFLDKVFSRAIGASHSLVPPSGGGNLRKRSKFNLVNFDPIGATPLEEGIRYPFLADLLDGKPLEETRLFAATAAGRSMQRRIERDGHSLKATITGGSSLEEYYEQCLALIDSIRCHGLIDPQEPQARGKVTGESISLAIGPQGELLHYTKGSHRLLIAKLLRLERIPVTIRCISGDYFRRFASRRDLLSEARLCATIRAAAAGATHAAALEAQPAAAP
jgi:hypothetical protein